jgi:purine nucleosidase
MAVKIVLNTDIGDNVDDAFALTLAARLPEAALLGVVTVGSAPTLRAQLARKVLSACGRVTVPVAGRFCPAVGRRTLAPFPRSSRCVGDD